LKHNPNIISKDLLQFSLKMLTSHSVA